MADRDPRVDDYLAGLPEWQRSICAQVRDIIHDPIDSAAMLAMFREVIAHNRADGW